MQVELTVTHLCVLKYFGELMKEVCEPFHQGVVWRPMLFNRFNPHIDEAFFSITFPVNIYMQEGVVVILPGPCMKSLMEVIFFEHFLQQVVWISILVSWFFSLSPDTEGMWGFMRVNSDFVGEFNSDP